MVCNLHIWPARAYVYGNWTRVLIGLILIKSRWVNITLPRFLPFVIISRQQEAWGYNQIPAVFQRFQWFFIVNSFQQQWLTYRVTIRWTERGLPRFNISTPPYSRARGIPSPVYHIFLKSEGGVLKQPPQPWLATAMTIGNTGQHHPHFGNNILNLNNIILCLKVDFCVCFYANYANFCYVFF